MKLKLWLKSKQKSIKVKNVTEIALIRGNLEIYLLEGSKIPSSLKHFPKQSFIVPGSPTPYYIAIDIPAKDISSYVIQNS